MGKQNKHESEEKAQMTEPVLWVKDYFILFWKWGGVESMTPYLDSRKAKLPEDSTYDMT